ncbi:cytochrome c oxidase assembly protein [Phenylobacterium sp.]|uniref:cytochrome c oxidase assembly protein n=1 Tax=Phenylobacterium sp. TaxID=1871053 RepID=UPI002DEF53A1|nr:cytochrome c oxidase assembly protein [Phenylobacterium sp.]
MSQTTPSERPPLDPQRRRNRNVAIVCGLTFFGMVGAAYAAIPIYRAFCQVTGYGGTVRRAEAAPDRLSDQKVTVSFDTNVRGLPWDFSAEQRAQTLRVGETKLAIFKVTNHADHPVTARAVFNVTPDSAGTYFRKLQCFCFSDQTIGAGRTVEMPVLYFVDPKFTQDINTKGVTDVTLSYTFFPAVDAKPPAVAAGS